MGCSSSLPTTFLPLQKATSLEEITFKSARFLENCLIIWIDDDETSDKFENDQEQLRKFFYGLKTFHNIDACIHFISSIHDEKIFLVISDACKTIEYVQHLPQLEKIYRYTTTSPEINHMKYWNQNHEILLDVENLSEQLRNDLELCEMDTISFTVLPASSKEISFSSILSKEEASFLFEQMIKEIVYRLKFDSGSKDVFIDFCRIHYANSHEQLSIIDDFAKNYRPNQALSWLRRRCFISQILNRVLRTREIDITYKLGFFIKQINLRLIRLHEENSADMKNIPVVYRGKTMINEDFDTLLKEKSGGLLSFPNFLLATVDKDIAIDFVYRRLALHPDRMGIIFEIEIDQTIFNEKNPFALLKGLSIDNDDVCFYLSTVFRIESVQRTTMNDDKVIWFVKLKPMNDDDPQLFRLTISARSDEMHANPGLYMGKLLVDMGEYRRAEQFLLGLLEDPSVLRQPHRVARLHNGLGAVYTYKNEHAKALYHYQQLLQTSLTYLQPDHPDLLSIYKEIGNSYRNQRNYALAIENYERAMELLKYGSQSANSEISADLYARIKEARQSMGS